MGAFYLISGNEEFSVKEAANELLRRLCGDEPEENPDLEIIRGDSDSDKFNTVLDRLLDSIKTPSFLSPNKIVWLKHFNKFEDAFGEASTKKKPGRIDLLSEFLKDGLPPDLTLIIDGPGLDRRKAFYKLCEKLCASSGGQLQWFEKADPKAKGYANILHRRVREMVMNAGKRIDDAAASYIAETSGSDAARLKNEIDKLVSYTGTSNLITLNDCYEICSRNSETLAWEFSSALAEKNATKAISLIPGIIEFMEQERGASSSSEIAIVASANAEFERLLGIRCEGARFSIPKNATADYFYRLFDDQKENNPKNPLFAMHPFRAFKTWENASRFSDAELVRVFKAILEASRGMVTGADPRIALETLVTKVTGMCGR